MIFKLVLFTFSAGTGLGWDAVRPRAMLRLEDDILYLWMALLEQCERLGTWPKGVGLVVVVLLPRAEGGFRPIGLIPNTPRIWMRVRRIEAKAWELSCDRKYLYAVAGRGSTVAAWKKGGQS